MRCRACGATIDEACQACPGCGTDTRYWACLPDGASYGPYSLAEIRQYVFDGRVRAGSVLRGADGKVLTLSEAGMVDALTASAYASSQGERGLGKGAKWGIIGLLAAVILPALVLFAVMASGFGATAFGVRGQAKQHECLRNLELVSMALMFYVEEHGGYLPSASTWRHDLLPYVGCPSCLVCPGCGGRQDSYCFNPAFSGKMLGEISNRERAPLIYETGLMERVPPHGGGGHVIYANLEVKWVSLNDF